MDKHQVNVTRTRSRFPLKLARIFGEDDWVIVRCNADQLGTPPLQLKLGRLTSHTCRNSSLADQQVVQTHRNDESVIRIFIMSDFILRNTKVEVINTKNGVYTSWHFDERSQLYVNPTFAALEGLRLQGVKMTKHTLRIQLSNGSEVYVSINRDHRWSDDLVNYNGLHNHYVSYRNAESRVKGIQANGKCLEVPYDS